MAWNDHIVLVRGWVAECGNSLECYLFSTRDPNGPEGVLTIGYVPQTEAKLAALNGAEVILEARVTDQNLNSGCRDRCPDIIPIRISRIVTPAHSRAEEN